MTGLYAFAQLLRVSWTNGYTRTYKLNQFNCHQKPFYIAELRARQLQEKCIFFLSKITHVLPVSGDRTLAIIDMISHYTISENVRPRQQLYRVLQQITNIVWPNKFRKYR